MARKLAIGPLHAGAIGTATGALLVVLAGFLLMQKDPRTLVDWDNFLWDGLDALRGNELRNWLLYPGSIGAIVGAAVGIALWTTLTRRPVALGFLILAWGVLGAVVGILLAIAAFVALKFRGHFFVGHDGSGGGGVAIIFLLMVASAFVLGSIVGIAIGIVKALNRKKNAEVHRSSV